MFPRAICTAILALILTFDAVNSQDVVINPGIVRITAVLSEGLLIQTDRASILVDAFVDPHESEGDSVLMDVRKKLLTGESLFASIQLSLVSHSHHEHFHPATAGTFLKNHPKTILAPSSTVIEVMREEYDEFPAIESQLVEIKIESGELISKNLAGIEVEFIPFNHESSVFYSEQFIGQIIHLGKKKIIYIGDAEMKAENWIPYKLRDKDIDLALIPYWLFKHKIARQIVEEQIAPAKVVVIQIPPAGPEMNCSSISELSYEVVFLNSTLESFEL